MILHGPILSLLLGSLGVSLVLLYAARHAVAILRHWDLGSGSEMQLSLERRTYLITTILTWAFAFQLVSLVLFVYTADELAQLFVGAMCAAGSLALNAYGYPALIAKLVSFLLAGVWLIVNAVDNRARDYPLLRFKCGLLLLVVPAVLLESGLQAGYFLALAPNVITSCCGSLFSATAGGLPAALFSLPEGALQSAYPLAGALTLAAGIRFLVRGGSLTGQAFAAASAALFVVALGAFISHLCLYIYELPTHRCPFCVFQAEYGHVGYPIYLFLLGGVVPALGVGALLPFRRIASLGGCLPRTLRHLVVCSLAMNGAFASLVYGRIATSHLGG